MPLNRVARRGLPGQRAAKFRTATAVPYIFFTQANVHVRGTSSTVQSLARPVENHKVNAELIFAAIHAKRFDSESDIQVQVRA